MSLIVFLILVAFVIALISVLYIPLPQNLADRRKLQVLEMLLRISNEYFGDLVEILFGTRVRNKLTRFLVGLPYMFQPKPPKWCTIKSEKIAGVKCRIYLPDKTRKTSDGLLVFVHGGGWCIMRPRFYDSVMYSLIARTGCTVVSIDYTLSPEVQYPYQILECQRVIETLYEEKHSEYGFNKEKIALLGDSAGGNLVAVLCQRLLKEGKQNYLKCQILIYPVIHALDFHSPSFQYYHQGYKGMAMLNPTQLARFYLLYLGIEPTLKNMRDITENAHLSPKLLESTKYKSLIDHSLLPESFFSNIEYEKTYKPSCNNELAEKFYKFATDSNFCAILGDNLKGLPPAMVLTCGIDILRDEGFLYTRRLQSFDVPTKWFHYENATHGHLNLPGSKQRKQMLDDITAFVKCHL
uniref:Alpha/beta hydrolase fold-3 domain-containing protein n=2 Tax=Acrobeloides nanus TaxID=290746 RepID=A0A914DAT8_9BILA